MSPVPTSQLDELIREYLQFQIEHKITLGSADEHLFDEKLTGAQRDWLGDFSRRWDVAVDAENVR